MSVELPNNLRKLLSATIIGGNTNHPLSGWWILTILRSNTQNAEEPITAGFLLRQFNINYLAPGENPIASEVFKNILDTLTKANLIEKSQHKVREQMHNGTRHIKSTLIFRINSVGLSFMNGLQKAADSQAMATANVDRIDEYCQLVNEICLKKDDAETSKLFNHFGEMIDASQDVLKGMHKLDADLSDLANDISFNHGSENAEILQNLLQKRAIPAFVKMIDTGRKIQEMTFNESYSQRIAASKQGTDSIDLDQMLGREDKKALDFKNTRAVVQTSLSQLNNSLESTQHAIDNSVDSVYMLYNTISRTIQLLVQEYEHSQKQRLDVKKMARQLDELMSHYDDVRLPKSIPTHLADDRGDEDDFNLLDASTLRPVDYIIDNSSRNIATEDDNPDIADDTYEESGWKQGMRDFGRALQPNQSGYAVVDHNIEFESQLARDEVAKLYTAIAYKKADGFSPFGRRIQRVTALDQTGTIKLHCKGEEFSVYLPHGFSIQFAGNVSEDI
ncbi:hypothetical protein LASUN_03800 [Lentilactobacillus sunkii]|jgi:archaellum component FlaC|uniref:Uncharacterized protein n=1 Tax=Lentilactobacillus sunkii TaxID=481719 RepID=A0A1E7XIF1_9LACO|nr:hypothetical protein [Lentilactobacillus sunkii]OFA12857.1 hypothetical protein LASUN_03800 [Lentilactobacillus sunkii]